MMKIIRDLKELAGDDILILRFFSILEEFWASFWVTIGIVVGAT
jgi:hypothetical protein